MTDFDNIPDELQGRDQWLYWNASSDKPRKPLASPAADYGCSWSDPDDWHDFETVREAAEAVPQAGIGFVNAQDNDDYPRGIIGSIDIDGAVDEGGRARDWVPSMDCFAERDAYQEWSPSETGLRIPVIGLDIPEWWSDFEDIDGEHKGVELLTNKFSTYTGNTLRGAGEEPVEHGDWLEDWLREVHKALAGEDPLAQGGIDRFGGDSGGPAASDEFDDEWLTEDAARDALDHIDPDLGHDRWRDIGFALEDHFPTATAKRLFTRWSRGGSKFDADAKREIESIVSGGGSGVTIATLISEAKDGGWDVSEHTPDPKADRVRTPKELVAKHSDEFDSPEDVPDDLFDGTGETATDGGADGDSDDEGEDEPDTWGLIRLALTEAENADERREPRYEAAMELNENHHFANLQENETLWCYNPETGIYEQTGTQTIRRVLTEQLRSQYRGQTMSVVDDHIRGRNTIPQEQMGGPEGKIAARNKVINIKADTTEPHSPEHMFTSRLGAEFDASAECPQWQAFLDQVVSSDTDRAKLQEYVGYCLHHWSMPYHKALFLVGPTASGKSTFLDTVNALLGEDTVASLTPQQLTTERFAPAEIYGKWANIRNDIPKETVKNTGTLKEVLAGDPLKAEEKRKDPYFFRPTAKHLFSANQLPEMEVDDEAFFRRILLVPFPETVPKADRDKHLADKLNDELPGILNWALEGLQRLLANGSFTGDRSPGKTQETWSKWGDSVERFASIALADGSKDIPKSDVYDAYLEFCRSEGMPSDTQHMMTRELKREGYSDDRAYVDGGRKRVFTAVSWTGRGEELLEAAQDDDSEQFGGLSEYR